MSKSKNEIKEIRGTIGCLIAISILIIIIGGYFYNLNRAIKGLDKSLESLGKNLLNKKIKKDTIYQDNEFLFIGNKNVKVDVIRQGEQKEIKSKGDTLFSNENVLFLGDLENEPEIFIKFNPRYQFEDFPVDVYKGKLSPPDFSTDEDAKRFITRISERSKNRPNFAGKLNFINWGCGTNCQSGVILNSETGEIYDGINTAWDFKSKPNSNLLIAEYGLFENKENEWLPFCSYCIPKYYVWNWKKKKLILLK